MAAGNTEAAIRIYQDALQLHPEWDEGRWNLAMLAYSAGRYPEAIVALKACVARRPDYGTAWAVLGLSEFEIKDYGNALIHLQRGQDLGMGGSKESVQLARYRLGVLLNRDAKFDLAAELSRGRRPRTTGRENPVRARDGAPAHFPSLPRRSGSIAEQSGPRPRAKLLLFYRTASTTKCFPSSRLF